MQIQWASKGASLIELNTPQSQPIRYQQRSPHSSTDITNSRMSHRRSNLSSVQSPKDQAVNNYIIRPSQLPKPQTGYTSLDKLPPRLLSLFEPEIVQQRRARRQFLIEKQNSQMIVNKILTPGQSRSILPEMPSSSALKYGHPRTSQDNRKGTPSQDSDLRLLKRKINKVYSREIADEIISVSKSNLEQQIKSHRKRTDHRYSSLPESTTNKPTSTSPQNYPLSKNNKFLKRRGPARYYNKEYLQKEVSKSKGYVFNPPKTLYRDVQLLKDVTVETSKRRIELQKMANELYEQLRPRLHSILRKDTERCQKKSVTFIEVQVFPVILALISFWPIQKQHCIKGKLIADFDSQIRARQQCNKYNPKYSKNPTKTKHTSFK